MIGEIRIHIQNAVHAITQIIVDVGGDKYKVSSILGQCENSFPRILLCDEIENIVKSTASQNYASLQYTVSLIEEVVFKFLEYKPSSKQEYKVWLIIRKNMDSLGEYFRKIKNIKSRYAPLSLFVNMMKDINSLLNYIEANIELILKSTIKNVFGNTVLVDKKDPCYNISNDNDMRIYCYALKHSNDRRRKVFLTTKDRGFKVNEEKWKKYIINKLHLISPRIEIIRM